MRRLSLQRVSALSVLTVLLTGFTLSAPTYGGFSGKLFELKEGGRVLDPYYESNVCTKQYTHMEFLAEVRYVNGVSVGTDLEVYTKLRPQHLILPNCILPSREELIQQVNQLKQTIAEQDAAQASLGAPAPVESRSISSVWLIVIAAMLVCGYLLLVARRKRRVLERRLRLLEEQNNALEDENETIKVRTEIFERRMVIVSLPEEWRSPWGDHIDAFARPLDHGNFPPSKGWIQLSNDSMPSKAANIDATLRKNPHEAEKAGLVRTKSAIAA